MVCADAQLWKYRRDSQLRAVKIQHHHLWRKALPLLLPLRPLRLQLHLSRNPRNRQQTPAAIQMRRVVVVVIIVVAVVNTTIVIVTGVYADADTDTDMDMDMEVDVNVNVAPQVRQITEVDRSLQVLNSVRVSPRCPRR